MALLILGLVIFLGAHALKLLAPAARTAAVARLGEGGWKGLFSLVSLAGFALICIGYGAARLNPVVLWTAPGWLYWVTLALMLPAMILLVAGNLPGSRIKQRVGHPMLLSVKVWAAAHLLVNGGLHDLLLFGGFLIWAVPDFIRLRRRDRANGTVYAARGPARDALVLGLGVLAYALLVGGLHLWLVGVRPLPG